MARKSKKKRRVSSSSSSSRSPSPQRKLPPKPKKAKSGQKSSKKEPIAKGTSAVSKRKNKTAIQAKTRTSPRRPSSSSSSTSGLGAGHGNKKAEVDIFEVSRPFTSSSLSTFRIPKLKEPQKAKDSALKCPTPAGERPETSKDKINKGLGLPSHEKYKTDLRPRVLLGQGSTVCTKAKDAKEQKAPVQNRIPKINQTPTRTVKNVTEGAGGECKQDPVISTIPATDRVIHSPVSKKCESDDRLKPLQAKRQLQTVSQTGIVNTLACKLNTGGNKDSQIQTFTSTFPDLPDYVDSDGEEGMEWENPVPQILKLVKEAPTNLPQNLNLPQEQNRNDDNYIGGEAEEMEVDVDPAEQLVIVPDTNIWIGDLKLIKLLLEEKCKPRIVIPWMVLQELDVGLHKNGLDKDRAREPVNFIHSLLSSRHPRVTGQRASDAAISKLKFDELMADDSILNCVFQMQKNNNIVIFLSNDRNLLNKALVNGVLACDSKSVLHKINEIVPGNVIDVTDNAQEILSPTSAPITTSLGHSVGSERKRKSESFNHRVPPSPLFNNLELDLEDDPMTGCQGPPPAKITAYEPNSPSESLIEPVEILESIRLAFSYIIRWKMVDDYGMGGWEFALKIKPPWSLQTAIKCMLTHWIANFSFVFSPKGKEFLERLSFLVAQYKSGLEESNENSIVETTLALFNLLDKALVNESAVLSCRQVLMSYAILHRT